jgi:hypothetical protein
MKKTPTKIVVFESSILYGVPISASIDKFIQKYKKDKKLKMLYRVPEVVTLEVQNRMWTLFQDKLRAFEASSKELTKVDPMSRTSFCSK